MVNSRRMPLKAVAKIGSKGRIYLPPEIRVFLHVTDGDHLGFREEKGRIYIDKVV